MPHITGNWMKVQMKRKGISPENSSREKKPNSAPDLWNSVWITIGFAFCWELRKSLDQLLANSQSFCYFCFLYLTLVFYLFRRRKIVTFENFSRGKVLQNSDSYLVVVYDETFYSIGSRKFLENCCWIFWCFTMNRILDDLRYSWIGLWFFSRQIFNMFSLMIRQVLKLEYFVTKIKSKYLKFTFEELF